MCIENVNKEVVTSPLLVVCNCAGLAVAASPMMASLPGGQSKGLANGAFRERPSGLIQLVLTVLVFWSSVLLVPLCLGT